MQIPLQVMNTYKYKCSVPSCSSVSVLFNCKGLHTALRNRYSGEQIQTATGITISIYMRNKKNTKEQMDCSSYSFCSSYI